MRKALFNILIIALLIVIAVSGYNLWKIFSEYHKGTKEYDKTAAAYVSVSSGESSSGDTTAGSVEPACPITVDFDSLREENEDVVGWIYCEDTQVNYPVLQGDNNDQYLHHMINGEYNSSGSIFMDSECKPDLSDINTIIYGHHMKNGSMFAALHQYTDQSYYDEHKVMWYLTPQHTYRLDIIAGYVGESKSVAYSNFSTQKELEDYLDFARSKSTFVPDEFPEDIRHIFILSTCAYEYDNARYVLVCVPVQTD